MLMSQPEFQPHQSEAHHNHADKFGHILARFHQSERDRLEKASRTLRDVLLPQFRALRVANIEAAYSGYGDSGAIDGLQYRDSAGQRVDRTTIPQPIIEELENCLYEFLPAGFEINDGSQGTLEVDLLANTLTLQHGQNEMISRETSQRHSLK